MESHESNPYEPISMAKMVDKPWGHEFIMPVGDGHIGKILVIKQGRRLSKQYHMSKDEVIMIYSGVARMELKDTSFRLTPFQAVHIEPGMPHRLIAETDVIAVETSNLADPNDIVRVEDDYGRESK